MPYKLYTFLNNVTLSLASLLYFVVVIIMSYYRYVFAAAWGTISAFNANSEIEAIELTIPTYGWKHQPWKNAACVAVHAVYGAGIGSVIGHYSLMHSLAAMTLASVHSMSLNQNTNHWLMHSRINSSSELTQAKVDTIQEQVNTVQVLINRRGSNHI